MSTSVRPGRPRTGRMPRTLVQRLREVGIAGEEHLYSSVRAGRTLWELSVEPSAGRIAPVVFVKSFESAGPYEREGLALAHMEPGRSPRLIADFADLLVIVTEGVPGRPLACAPSGRADAWLQACLPPVLASIGLPGAWPQDPVVALTDAQRAVAAELVAREPSAATVLDIALTQPLLIPCHGDVSGSNLIIDDDQPAGAARGYLLDFEFYGLGDALADLAALCLTPSLSVAIEDRLSLLGIACGAAEARTGTRLMHRLAGSVALWAVQCATWHRSNPSPGGGEAMVQTTLDLAAATLTPLKGVTT